MENWIQEYVKEQSRATVSIDSKVIAKAVDILIEAVRNGRQIFIAGNGGSSANATHFATDLGKSASDKVGERFKVMSLNDNMGWVSALANDYSFEEVFSGQLQNYGKPKDVCIAISVSGNSPNTVKMLTWAKEHKLKTIAMVGVKRGKMAEIADQTIVIDSTHYGRVEDAQMTALHLLCYAFIEHPEWAKSKK